jgi:hypothetical protein
LPVTAAFGVRKPKYTSFRNAEQLKSTADSSNKDPDSAELSQGLSNYARALQARLRI